jgi:hypothetical protein
VKNHPIFSRRWRPGLLLRLPHDVLVDLFMRVVVRDLGRLASTCRLLQYGQSSPQTPNPVENALRVELCVICELS